MKVYPDSNIYVSYLLGEENARQAEEFFRLGVACKFSLVASKTTFGEVAKRCEDHATLLLRHHIEKFEAARKLDVVVMTPEERETAIDFNLETGLKYGFNDFLHALLARRHADVFVSNDAKFRPVASRIVKTVGLEEFLARLKPQFF